MHSTSKKERRTFTQLADRPVRERQEKFTQRIMKSTHLPPQVKQYLINLMKRRPNHSSMAVATLMTTIPQIIIGKNISKRKSVDAFLEKTRDLCFESEPMTKQEFKEQRQELVEENWFSPNEIDKIMSEIAQRKGISEFGAHSITHYFVCIKILDRLEREKTNK